MLDRSNQMRNAQLNCFDFVLGWQQCYLKTKISSVSQIMHLESVNKQKLIRTY